MLSLALAGGCLVKGAGCRVDNRDMTTSRTRTDRDQGFTLIELLVTGVVLGVLAGIAITVFIDQRKKGIDATLVSDLNSAAKAVESLAADEPLDDSALTAADLAGEGFEGSPENQVDLAGSRADGFCVRAWNDGGTATSAAQAFWYDSKAGGLVASAGGAPSGGVCAGVGAGDWVSIG